MWKVDANGIVQDESYKLKAIIRSSFKDTSIVCQLFSSGNSVYVFANIYYPDIKKVISTMIKTDSDLKVQSTKRYQFDFDHYYEKLQKIVVEPEKNITILKKETDEKDGYILNVVKINLQNSKLNEANFHSNTPFSYPDVMFNDVDSSTIVYAQMTRTYYQEKLIRHIFFATLNDTLGQATQPAVLKVPIAEDTYGAFTCLNMSNGYNNWLPVHGTWNTQYFPTTTGRNLLVGLSRMVTLEGKSISVVNASSYQPKLQAIHPSVQMVLPPGDVKFSVVNNVFKNISDTLIRYRKRTFIEVAQYSSFNTDNKNYLLLKEQFPSRGKGLVLINLNKQGAIVPSPLRLYERFHYSLPQLQSAGKGKVIMPFVFRSEVGLVRMTIDAT